MGITWITAAFLITVSELTSAQVPQERTAVANVGMIERIVASISDGRLKTQQRPLEGATEILGRLRPKRFLLHTGQFDPQGRLVLNPDPVPSVGLIAQEAAGVVPEAVLRPVDETKDFWALDYTKLVPILVRAVQQQQADLGSKASQISNLESQVSELQEEVKRLFEITETIDKATRAAVAGLRFEIDRVNSKAESANGKSSCSCSGK